MAKSAKSGRAPTAATIDDPAKTNSIIVGKSTKYEVLDLHFANRHGLVAGATGTGKTVSLQVLAEGLSEAGVSVFAADIKGDLSGIAAVGETKEALVARDPEARVDQLDGDSPVVRLADQLLADRAGDALVTGLAGVDRTGPGVRHREEGKRRQWRLRHVLRDVAVHLPVRHEAEDLMLGNWRWGRR